RIPLPRLHPDEVLPRHPPPRDHPLRQRHILQLPHHPQRSTPVRQQLPLRLPRVEVRHLPLHHRGGGDRIPHRRARRRQRPRVAPSEHPPVRPHHHHLVLGDRHHLQ